MMELLWNFKDIRTMQQESPLQIFASIYKSKSWFTETLLFADVYTYDVIEINDDAPQTP